MSYATHAAMAQSSSLRGRMTACAAQEGVDDPQRWITRMCWNIPGSDWVAAWDYAEDTNPGADHGANAAVITDQMMLSAIQPMVTG